MNSRIVLGATLATSLFLGSCSSTRRDTAIGAGTGAAAGALLGGLASGNWKGAIVGAAAGAAVGGGIGLHLDKRREELAKVAETKKTRDGLLVKLKNELLFETGKSDLKSGATTEVSKLGDILAKYPDDKIKIVGHTDNTGKREINETLSQERAENVMGVLRSRGVKDAQMVSEGRADSDPLADNSTVEGRAQNRRVELHIQVQDPNAKGKKGQKKS